MKKAYVHFNADASVGCLPYGYTIEIPDFEEECREDVRKKIETLYTELDGEFIVSYVVFYDEKESD